MHLKFIASLHVVCILSCFSLFWVACWEGPRWDVGIKQESICIEDYDAFLPALKEGDLKDKLKVFVFPFRFKTYVASFIAQWVDGLEKKGWKMVDSDTMIITGDPLFDIQTASGVYQVPDIVAFYILRDETLDRWETLPDMPFTKILIAEDLNFSADIHPTQRFAQWGDAIFARYPEALTQVIAPQKIFCVPFYHAAGSSFLLPELSYQKKNKALLSGAISYAYPLREAAYALMLKEPSFIEQLPHPGYNFNVDPQKAAQEYAAAISHFKIAIAGSSLSVPGPYILAKHFEIAATGTVMLTDSFMAPYLLPLGFRENIHYITADPENLALVLRDWLHPQNKEKLEQIGKNGAALVRERHTIKQRMEQFHEMALRVDILRTKRRSQEAQ